MGLLALKLFSAEAAPQVVASFQAGTGGWQMGTLAVGDIAGDSKLEIVVPYRDLLTGQWFLDAYQANGTRIFSYNSGFEEMNVSPTLYDLDGDGKMEIIITRGNSVVALRGNGSVLWSNQVSAANYVPQAGFMAVTNGFYWSADGLFRSRLPSTAVFSSQFSSPMVADFNGTGTKEIVTAWKIDPDSASDFQDYNPFVNDLFGLGEWGTVGESWSGGVVYFDALTGNRTMTYHLHQLVESGLGLGRSHTNRTLQTYVLNDSDSVVCFDKSKPHGFLGNGMLHGMFGKNLRMTTGYYQQAIDIYPCDLDGDGRDELLSVTTQINPLWQPHESVLDDDGALLWRKWKQPITPPVNQNGWYNNAAMFPCNPDHDNHIDVLGFTHSYEITYRYWNGVELVDHPGWPKDFYPLMPTPPVVGDIDGDGQEEIIIGTYNPALNPSVGSLNVYTLDGTLKVTVPVPGGLKHIPSLADVNGDGSLDVVYRSLAGVVSVLNFGATNASSVSWSTHRGNAQRDGNLGRPLFPAGTPLVTRREGGALKANFSWTATNASMFRIFRAETAAGPFKHVATLTGAATNYTDFGLRAGWQYFYEVGAVIGTNTVHSAPFAILSMVTSNLVANGGMEENDNSHWDKWDTGDVDWTNMTGSTNAYQGRQSMQLRLQNQPGTDTLNQFVQYGIPRSYLPVVAGTIYSFGGFLKTDPMTAASEHWFEWTSSLTGEATNARPAVPYPNYFTPSLMAGTAASPWTYFNRVFVMPAGIPNVELRHRFAAPPISGNVYLDNLFFRPLPPAGDTRWTSAISFGATWRYLAVAPAANWFSESFNDTAWPAGYAKFGAGGTPTNVVTLLPSNVTNFFFRRTFVLSTPLLEELLLAAFCTDDYGGNRYPLRVWLNGQEVVTSGIEATSGSGNDLRYFDLLPFASLLRAGTNTLAVQMGNYFETGWDDVAFDLNLRIIPSTNAQPRLESVRRNVSTSTLTILSPALSVFRVESIDGLNATWQLVQTVTNSSGGLQTITDSGQNGRLPPSSVPNRFYRLIPF